MQINLYTCNAERNRVDKTAYLSNRFVVDGTFKRSTSALNIEIDLEKTNPLTYEYNYMYIDEFKRWYYITDIETINNTLWRISAKTDVLMSFKGDIRNSRAIADKIDSESKANLYLDDGSFVMDSRKYNTIKEFSAGFNENGSYILICAGGL